MGIVTLSKVIEYFNEHVEHVDAVEHESIVCGIMAF